MLIIQYQMNQKYKIKATKQQPQQQQPKQQQHQTIKQDEQIVYFRLRAPIQQNQPEQQLIVNRYGRKKENIRKKLQQEEEEKKQEQRQQRVDDIKQVENLFSEINLKKSVQFFLKRVDDLYFNPQHNQTELQKFKDTVNQKSNKLSSKQRQHTRQELFNKLRGIQPTTKKVRIIDFSQQYVELGLQKIPVQNLGNLKNYYYVLSKRETVKQGPTVSLPEGTNYLFDKIDFEQQISQEQMVDQDQDSNRESNPDYDYPEQDYHDGDSQDEGVIHKDYYPGYGEDQDDRNQSDYELDEEQIYRRYLKRCKNDRNKQSDDDQYF